MQELHKMINSSRNKHQPSSQPPKKIKKKNLKGFKPQQKHISSPSPLGVTQKKKKTETHLEKGEKKILNYPDENRKILARKPASPPVQHTLNVLPMVKLNYPLDHLGYSPVFLKAITLDSQTVAFRKVRLPDTRDSGGQLVCPGVVVHLGLLLLFEWLWIFRLGGAIDCRSGGCDSGVRLFPAGEEWWLVV